MRVGRLKNYLAYTFLVIFLSLKLISLHALTHYDDGVIEHCEVCEVISVANFTPLANDTSENHIGNNIWFYAVNNISSDYNFTYDTTVDITCLFSRPPPFSI